jgi:hypothetical protein
LARVVAVNKSAAVDYYLMAFSKATAAVNGDTPIVRHHLDISSSVDLNLANVGGIYCALGISVAISTTPDTLTLAASDDLHYTAFWK